MNNIRRFIMQLSWIVGAVLACSGATTYQFGHLPGGMQLSSKLVNVIYQDEGGFVYFGTASGLDRYDGYGVKAYTRDDADSTSLHDSFVEDIQRAPDGRLWVRAGERYSVFDPASDRFDRNMEAICASMGLPAVPSLVAFGADGSCWAWIEGRGLFRSRDGKCQKIEDPDGRFVRSTVYDLENGGTDRIVSVDGAGRVVFVDTRTSRICGETTVPGSENMADHVYTVYTDREGLLWVYSDWGLWLYNPATGYWRESLAGTELPQGNVKSLLQDRQGRMWIGFDREGVAVLEKDGRLSRVKSVTGDSRTLSSNTVTALMEDRTGSIWMGSRKNGVSIYNDAAFKFDFAPFPDVNCICEGNDNTVFLGTDGSGLIVWNRTDGTSRYIDVSRPGHGQDAIVDLALDADGVLWVGTYGGGLLRLGRDGRLSRLTTADGLAFNSIWAVQPMPGGDLLLATLGAGVQRFNPSTGASEVFNSSNSALRSDYAGSICEGPGGTYYISTSSGLGVYDPVRNEMVAMTGDRRGSRSFDSDNINQVMCDSRGLLWVATRDGLNVYDAAADSLYSVSLGGQRRFVLGVAEDGSHAVWVCAGSELISVGVSAAQDGSWAFDTHSYDSSDGLQTCDFNQRSLCALSDGEMMVGGFYGVNRFRPGGLKFGSVRPRVYFTGLSLFNQPVGVGDEHNGRVLLPRRLSLLDAVELDYDDNEFAVSFATDNYVNPEKTRYFYRLDGFSEEWRELPDNIHSVAYTNLAPGRYTLRVKARTADGVESENVASLGLHVRPPFYATTGAKLLYVVLVLALGFGAFRVVRGHERRLSKRREELEATRKQEELDQLKFRFFTNVSHELRTPLTLITAPLESLMKQDLDGVTREKLEIIHGNADRLMRMVNQLLDFRKNEMAGLTLNPSRGDIVRFMRNVCDGFRSLAESRHIHLTFFSSVESLTMDFDEDKMAKTVMNLLSNAFKFTPENGRVDMSLSLSGDNLEIAIADTGCGISDEDKQRIFERFYQADGGRNANGGTGIGLNLVAEFVRLHGGTVSVADNGAHGTVFTVSVPVRGGVAAAHEQRPVAGATAPATAASAVPRLLVVDDNPDLLRFMSGELSGDYAVVTAPGGNEALAEIASYVPDIIVSDLMMPGMDGIELCRRLKGDEATASIPLLILTAKHEVAAKIEGLTLGADDYMTKPFNIDVLRLRLKKLLDLRGRGARRALIEPEPEYIAITSLDEKLIEQAVGYVDKNMSRPELSVEELAAELGMSRVHLYKRLKQITGKTPIEFIRILRLKRAAQLLRESQLNISEIAYRCGFNNPKYFSRYFKEEFGVLPSVYQEKEGK